MAAWYDLTGSNVSSTYYVTPTTSTVTNSYAGTNTGTGSTSASIIFQEVVPDKFTVNKPMTITMKDGSILTIDEQLNFKVIDKDAKVLYKGNRIREFNKYINASDLLEQFIADMGKLGAVQNNILNTPIEIFINWLIIKASEQDGDILEERPKLTQLPKCKCCGKFISKKLAEKMFYFCNPGHSEKYFKRILE